MSGRTSQGGRLPRDQRKSERPSSDAVRARVEGAPLTQSKAGPGKRSLSRRVARLACDDPALCGRRHGLAVVLELERWLVEVEGPNLRSKMSFVSAGHECEGLAETTRDQSHSERTSSRWR